MTVKEMIEKLKKIDPNTEVYMSCYGLEYDLHIEDVKNDGTIECDYQDLEINEEAMANIEEERERFYRLDAEQNYRNVGE